MRTTGLDKNNTSTMLSDINEGFCRFSTNVVAGSQEGNPTQEMDGLCRRGAISAQPQWAFRA
jgi:hypothetical protein